MAPQHARSKVPSPVLPVPRLPPTCPTPDRIPPPQRPATLPLRIRLRVPHPLAHEHRTNPRPSSFRVVDGARRQATDVKVEGISRRTSPRSGGVRAGGDAAPLAEARALEVEARRAFAGGAAPPPAPLASRAQRPAGPGPRPRGGSWPPRAPCAAARGAPSPRARASRAPAARLSSRHSGGSRARAPVLRLPRPLALRPLRSSRSRASRPRCSSACSSRARRAAAWMRAASRSRCSIRAWTRIMCCSSRSSRSRSTSRAALSSAARRRRSRSLLILRPASRRRRRRRPRPSGGGAPRSSRSSSCARRRARSAPARPPRAPAAPGAPSPPLGRGGGRPSSRISRARACTPGVRRARARRGARSLPFRSVPGGGGGGGLGEGGGRAPLLAALSNRCSSSRRRRSRLLAPELLARPPAVPSARRWPSPRCQPSLRAAVTSTKEEAGRRTWRGSYSESECGRRGARMVKGSATRSGRDGGGAGCDMKGRGAWAADGRRRGGGGLQVHLAVAVVAASASRPAVASPGLRLAYLEVGRRVRGAQHAARHDGDAVVGGADERREAGVGRAADLDRLLPPSHVVVHGLRRLPASHESTL